MADQRTPEPTVAPILVTQRSAPAVLGVTPRQYLDLVKSLGLPHRRAGKLVFTSPDVWRGLVVDQAPAVPKVPAHSTPAEPTPRGIDAVLAAIGRKRVA
jgi:hypothetical protein